MLYDLDKFKGIYNQLLYLFEIYNLIFKYILYFIFEID